MDKGGQEVKEGNGAGIQLVHGLDFVQLDLDASTYREGSSHTMSDAHVDHLQPLHEHPDAPTDLNAHVRRSWSAERSKGVKDGTFQFQRQAEWDQGDHGGDSAISAMGTEVRTGGDTEGDDDREEAKEGLCEENVLLRQLELLRCPRLGLALPGLATHALVLTGHALAWRRVCARLGAGRCPCLEKAEYRGPRD